jgi:hypothetical protein
MISNPEMVATADVRRVRTLNEKADGALDEVVAIFRMSQGKKRRVCGAKVPETG